MKTQTTASGGVGLGRGGRMSRQRKRDAVVRLLRGEDLEILSRALGVTAATLSGWQDTFVAAGEASLATQSTDGVALETERLKAKLGEMLLERELLDAKIAALEANRPLARRRSRPRAGLSRPQAAGPMVWPACAGSGAPHAPPPTGIAPSRPEPSRRLGPVGAMPDPALLEAIRAVLGASPFHGEGHRKVWARLRVAGVRTSNRRVLRLMREHDLLAPSRAGAPRGPRIGAQQLDDLSRSLTALEQDSTVMGVIEMSQASWLVAGLVPGIERHPLKKWASPCGVEGSVRNLSTPGGWNGTETSPE